MLNDDHRRLARFSSSADESYARFQRQSPGRQAPLEDDFTVVSVLPYIGAHYGNPSALGVRVMVLGESHYDKDGPLHRTYTRDVLEDFGDGFAFFTKVAGVFYGRKPNAEMKRQFWPTIVFYNFIQESVGIGPGIRPKPEMWARGASPLLEVLTRCRPNFVLVLGMDLWNNLGIPLTEGPILHRDDGHREASNLYRDEVLFLKITHPSSYGWTYRKWTPWVHAAIAAVGQI
jgi:hypothetical protein